jgi:hypothetical protein
MPSPSDVLILIVDDKVHNLLSWGTPNGEMDLMGSSGVFIS